MAGRPREGDGRTVAGKWWRKVIRRGEKEGGERGKEGGDEK